MTVLFNKKKSFLVIAAIFLSFIFLNLAWAEKASANKVNDAQKTRKILKDVKDQLNGSTWEITLTQMTSEKKKRKTNDTLNFVDNQIKSKELTSDGFLPSNFTLSLKGEDIVIWETMQTSDKKGLAFWKGEVENGVMRGVLSRHLADNKVKDYSFVSSTKKELNPELVVEELESVSSEFIEEVEVVAAPDVEIAQDEAKIAQPELKEDPEQAAKSQKKEKTKKKKGWFR